MYDVRAPPGGEVLTRSKAAFEMRGSSWRLPSSARVRRVCFVSMLSKGKGQYTRQGVLPSVFFFPRRRKVGPMIPDSFPLFNCHSVPKHFDDAEARLRFHLQQDAVPTLAGGRHLLYVCPVCQRPFYVAGRRTYPRLTDEQLSHLGSTFHADVHALHLLPRSLCPICSTIYLDGLFTIEAYQQDASLQCQGYHLLWESASPPYSTLVAMVYQPASLPLRTLLSLEPDTLLTPMREVRALLAWLEMRPCPTTARVYSDEERHLLARRLPPVSGLSRHDEAGEPRLWWGYAWRERSPLARGGTVLVSLAATVSPLAPAPLSSLLQAWRVLARAMRTVL